MINQDNSKGRERTKEGRDYFKNKTLKLKEGQRISPAEKHESTHAHTHEKQKGNEAGPQGRGKRLQKKSGIPAKTLTCH